MLEYNNKCIIFVSYKEIRIFIVIKYTVTVVMQPWSQNYLDLICRLTIVLEKLEEAPKFSSSSFWLVAQCCLPHRSTHHPSKYLPDKTFDPPNRCSTYKNHFTIDSNLFSPVHFLIPSPSSCIINIDPILTKCDI